MCKTLLGKTYFNFLGVLRWRKYGKLSYFQYSYIISILKNYILSSTNSESYSVCTMWIPYQHERNQFFIFCFSSILSFVYNQPITQSIQVFPIYSQPKVEKLSILTTFVQSSLYSKRFSYKCSFSQCSLLDLVLSLRLLCPIFTTKIFWLVLCEMSWKIVCLFLFSYGWRGLVIHSCFF